MRLLQAVRALRARCHAFLLQQLPPDAAHAAAAAAGDVAAANVPPPDGRWGLGSFTIERGMHQASGVWRLALLLCKVVLRHGPSRIS